MKVGWGVGGGDGRAGGEGASKHGNSNDARLVFNYLFSFTLIPLESAVRATLAAESVTLSHNLLMFLLHSLMWRRLSAMRPGEAGTSGACW